LQNNLAYGQLAASLDTLKNEGPFEPAFMADMILVFDILHACWGKSTWWTHVKKIKGKNGRQVWRTLHTALLGGDRITSTGSAIVAKLQTFRLRVTKRTSTLTSMRPFTLSSIINMLT